MREAQEWADTHNDELHSVLDNRDASQMQYNVLVDFGTVAQPGLIEEVFDGTAIHVEEIGPDQYQVGLGIHAPSGDEAYRRGVNLVEAMLATIDADHPDWVDAKVYDK